jgi:nicotinate phosphoribosyltransferase
MWPSADAFTGLMTDQYHPDAAYVSWRAGRNGLTTFDLYTRVAPFGGAYLLAAGLDLALDFVERFRYADEDIAYLRSTRPYEAGFFDELRRLQFTGEILAMPEGEVAFPNEPLLRVTAPFREALLLESGLLHLIGVSTLIATKAARVVHAAQGRPVAEFSFRRAQAPFIVARASAIGGCASTSFLFAARALGLPASGTIPHALVQLFDSEREAFMATAESLPRYTLLLDTYDVHRAVLTAIDVAHEVKQRLGHTLVAVRLDSGDLAADSRVVRAALDAGGLPDVRVLASGDLDEFRIEELLAENAPIDAFGVGTSLGVGAGSPGRGLFGGALAAVYKSVWYADGVHPPTPTIKTAGEKSTRPGRKQVYRIGAFECDIICEEAEPAPQRGAPLLRPVMRDGRVLPGSRPRLSESVAYARTTLARLPDEFRALACERPYPVRFSQTLDTLRTRAIARTDPTNRETRAHGDEP